MKPQQEKTGLEKEIARTLKSLRNEGHRFIVKETDNEILVTHDLSDAPESRKNWIHITKVTGPKIDMEKLIRSAIEGS